MASRRRPNVNNTPSSPPDRQPDDDLLEDEVEEGMLSEPEEEPEGDDLLDADIMAEDIRELRDGDDDYDSAQIDTAEYEPLGPAAIRAVNQQLAARDRNAVDADGRLPGALLTSEDDGERVTRRRRRRRPMTSSEGPDADMSEMSHPESEDGGLGSSELELGPQDVQGPLREWVLVESNRRAIGSMFRKFLLRYVDGKGTAVYGERITRMCRENRASLEVDFLHLSQGMPALALWVADAPGEVLPIFDAVAMRVVLMSFPNYRDIAGEVHVRLGGLPVADSLRDIRQIHLNCLIRVSGVVTRRTGVFPQLRRVRYNCAKCSELTDFFTQQGHAESKPLMCLNCQSRGPFQINTEETVYSNYQKMTLQESPGTVPAGRLPRSKEVILLGDLIDCARPGEEVDVTGILKNTYDVSLNVQHGFPVFATVLEANHVARRAVTTTMLTDEDRQQILRMSRDPRIGQKIIASIAPSIYGHDDIKTALALALFGGTAKNVKDKHRIRGDINVLLMGDPGTAKSQFLKFVEKTSHRAVFTTGRGSSAVGLTASVHRDPVTREWTLEGGALVLADQGVCLIDEFDKMNDMDRTSIHEAMEQQSISISKAGIVTTLQARCSVIAAANPRLGRYDPTMDFASNVELTDPILSRFDILCVVRDVIDPFEDEYLAAFVVNSHVRSHPDNPNHEGLKVIEEQLRRSGRVPADREDIIPQPLLSKYIAYARQNCVPRLQDINDNKLTRLYAELRAQSAITGGISISVRHMESMIRASEAHARMHLREYVRDEDVDMAIRVFLSSFVGAQKTAVKRQMEQHFARYMTFNRDNNALLMSTLQQLVRTEISYQVAVHSIEPETLKEVRIPMRELQNKATEMGISEISTFLRSEAFAAEGFSIDAAGKSITKKFDQGSS